MPKYKIDPDSEVKGTGTGYVYVTTTPDYKGPGIKKMKDHKKKYVPRSRVLLENKLNRPIDPNKEEIHHKNENKKDDSPSNIEVKTREDHSKGHAVKNKFWKNSPRTKPRTAMVHKVVANFLNADSPKSVIANSKTWTQISKEYEKRYGAHNHCLTLKCSQCGGGQTCRCRTPKTTEVGLCWYCTGERTRPEQSS